jgi:glycosyltransferase involved in cell wall biosynthesis
LHGLDGEVGWFYDNIAWRDSRLNSRLVNCLLEWNASTLLVQYHPAFFPGILLESLVDDMTAAGIRIAIIVHSFSTCDLDSLKRLSRNGVLLFAHSRGEVRDAAAREVSLIFLPLAVDRPLARNKKMPTTRNWTTQPPIIATTGFIRQHKGLPELIRAIGLLRDEFPQIELRAQCALYPSEDSRQELTNCLAAIEETGLGATVFLDTGFYPLDQLHERLARADLPVLPYGSSSEGGSAAAATCLGVGLPLVVSGALIFDELRDTAFTLESNSPTSIAQALARILRSQELYEQLIHQANNYAESHSWEAVSKQLAGALA